MPGNGVFKAFFSQITEITLHRKYFMRLSDPSRNRYELPGNLLIIKLFIRQCLFFRSREKINQILGLIGWLSLILLVYSLGNLIVMGVSQSV